MICLEESQVDGERKLIAMLYINKSPHVRTSTITFLSSSNGEASVLVKLTKLHHYIRSYMWQMYIGLCMYIYTNMISNCMHMHIRILDLVNTCIYTYT